MKRILTQLASPEAAEIAEAALVLPLAFMFLLGIIWFGRAFNIYSTITQAAQQGAIAAARDSCATCAGGNAPPSTAAVNIAINNVMQASGLDVTQMTAPSSAPNCGTQACISCPPVPPASCTKVTGNPGGSFYVCQNVQLNSTTPQCGVIVAFQYPFQLLNVPFTSLSSITMSAQAQSRMEN